MNSKRFTNVLEAILLCVALLAVGPVRGENSEVENTADLDINQLLSAQQVKRSQALDELLGKYNEISTALLETLREAKTQFGIDHRYHSPLHCAILAVDTWQVIGADDLLLSVVDYELDMMSLPDGIDVPGDYFYPAASALVHLRVDAAKIVTAIEAADNEKTLRILTWILFEREKGIDKAKWVLSDKRSKSHGGKEKTNIEDAIELLGKPSQLLPHPSGNWNPGSEPSHKETINGDIHDK